jgi:sulfur carrier protein
VITKGNNVLDVIVNGESRALTEPVSVSQLIQDMDLQGKRIAIEINGEIVPASQYTSVQLSNGDNIEIVGAIGGG